MPFLLGGAGPVAGAWFPLNGNTPLMTGGLDVRFQYPVELENSDHVQLTLQTEPTVLVDVTQSAPVNWAFPLRVGIEYAAGTSSEANSHFGASLFAGPAWLRTNHSTNPVPVLDTKLEMHYSFNLFIGGPTIFANYRTGNKDVAQGLGAGAGWMFQF